jgi:hypothetical protein
MARVSAVAITLSTLSSESSGAMSPEMSVSHRACSARPVSVAMATRRLAYPLKPSARLNRVTVAVEVPVRSARSTMLAWATDSGSPVITAAIRASASGMVGPSMRSRSSSPPLPPVIDGHPFHSQVCLMKITTVGARSQ